MQVYVRTASKRDIEAVRSLLADSWHDSYDDILGADIVRKITENWHSTEVLGEKLSQPNSEFVLADTGEQIVGMAYANEIEKVVNLHQLYVLPDQQGKGAGTALMQEIIFCFDEAKKVRAEVVVGNSKAVQFYENHGFRKVELVNRVVLGDLRLEVEVMELELN